MRVVVALTAVDDDPQILRGSGFTVEVHCKDDRVVTLLPVVLVGTAEEILSEIRSALAQVAVSRPAMSAAVEIDLTVPVGDVPLNAYVQGRGEITRQTIEAAKAEFSRVNGREPTTVLFNNVAVRDVFKWHPGGPAILVPGEPIPDLCGLKVVVAVHVARNPGFIVV